MDNINTESNSYREAVKCQEKSGFRDLVIMASVAWEMKQYGQDFLIFSAPRIEGCAHECDCYLKQLRSRIG